MDLYSKLTEVYEELQPVDFHPEFGTILLQDDGDGVQYIAKWNYLKAMPKGFKLGK